MLLTKEIVFNMAEKLGVSIQVEVRHAERALKFYIAGVEKSRKEMIDFLERNRGYGMLHIYNETNTAI